MPKMSRYWDHLKHPTEAQTCEDLMKTATVRLYVALVSLLAAVLELGASLVRLVTALTQRATVAVQPRAASLPASPQARLRIVPRPIDTGEKRTRLIIALNSLGWSMPAVRRFVDGLGDRVEREPIEALIKEGIAKLAA
jgi:hypothetical protein